MKATFVGNVCIKFGISLVRFDVSFEWLTVMVTNEVSSDASRARRRFKKVLFPACSHQSPSAECRRIEGSLEPLTSHTHPSRGRQMRVYTRGINEGLMIGTGVQVSVLEVQGDRVRLAIIDPDSSPTYREEVLFLHSPDDDDTDTEEGYSAEYVPISDLLGTTSLMGSLR